MRLGAALICAKSEPFMDLTITSIGKVVDEIIIVGDPNEETRKKIFSTPFSSKIRLFWRDWDGRYGRARQMAVDNLTTDWVWQIDCDEVASDNAYLLREYAKSGKFDCYAIRYEHFVYNLNTLDFTMPEHISQARLFKRDEVRYNRDLHELAYSVKWKSIGIIKDVIVWHLGLVRGLEYVRERAKLNLEHKDRTHSPEWVEWWTKSLMLGTYPTKPRVEPLPVVLEKMVKAQ